MQHTEIKHFIILESECIGPLSTTEVIRFFEENPENIQSILWISPECRAPLLLIEWFSDFAQLETLDFILSRAAPPPSARPVRKEDKKTSSDPQKSEKSDVPLARVKPSDFLNPSSYQRRWREWLALLGFGLLGIALFTAGLRSIRPHRTLVRSESSLRAKLMSATPDAMAAYRQLLEGKILRDGKKYSSALLLMQKDKSLYPEGHLPSVELSAALALTHLSPSELDNRQEWKELLLSLPAEARQRGVAVLGYEISRVSEARRAVAFDRTKNRLKKISMAVDEAYISLERLTRAIPNSEPENKTVHGLFLAKAVSLSLITFLQHPQTTSQLKELAGVLEKVSLFDPYLLESDRAIIGLLAATVKQRMSDKNKAISWSVLLDTVAGVAGSSGGKLLCQLNDSGSATDTILFTMSQALQSKQKIPELQGLYESCFVGLRAYSNVSNRAPISESGSTMEYVSAGRPDEGLVLEFRRSFPTMSPVLKRLSGAKNSTGDWLLMLHLNGISEGWIAGGAKFPSKEKLCGKSVVKENICLLALWSEMRGRWRDALPLLNQMQDEVAPADLAQLIQRFVLDAAREILLGGSRQKLKDMSEVFATLKNQGASDYPDLQFVLDYVRTFEGES